MSAPLARLAVARTALLVMDGHRLRLQELLAARGVNDVEIAACLEAIEEKVAAIDHETHDQAVFNYPQGDIVLLSVCG